ncbi:hypothetical protein BDP81DRAFT_128594 [Colletotrichum phormii]|uniref:Uncharacterized protein n=1 Tax=Colletotrichum phormii TaxID=359342 RepID=A0AAJ0A096_9PEZI|nr:uncharacterized protein BDP81DRAFT_128594 [Colletotrichum phormii]KAK1641151.1 hypothetical protein BDP81DRAFT_128594 [Colletotrichum phormii]
MQIDRLRVFLPTQYGVAADIPVFKDIPSPSRMTYRFHTTQRRAGVPYKCQAHRSSRSQGKGATSMPAKTQLRSCSVSVGCIGQKQPQPDGTDQQLAVWKQTARCSVRQRPDITTLKSQENHNHSLFRRDATLRLCTHELCACTLTGYKSGHFLSLRSSLDPNRLCPMCKPFQAPFSVLPCPWAMTWVERKQQYPLLPAMPCKEDLFRNPISKSWDATTRGSFLGRVGNKMEPGNNSRVAWKYPWAEQATTVPLRVGQSRDKHLITTTTPHTECPMMEGCCSAMAHGKSLNSNSLQFPLWLLQYQSHFLPTPHLSVWSAARLLLFLQSRYRLHSSGSLDLSQRFVPSPLWTT